MYRPRRLSRWEIITEADLVLGSYFRQAGRSDYVIGREKDSRVGASPG